MPTDTPFEPQQLYSPSEAEVESFTSGLSAWMDLRSMDAGLQAIEGRAGHNVHTAPQFKIVREGRQAHDFAAYLRSKGRQVEALRMNAGPRDWPDFWLRMNGEELPCELTTIHNPDQTEMWIPIHRNDEGNLILNAKTDYSTWPEDQFIKAISHAGLWKGKVNKAIRGGQEIPLGIWPQGDIMRYLPTWTEEAVLMKNEKARNGNYVEGTVLVIVAEFEIKFNIPLELIDRLHAVMERGTAFRAVFLHVPNSMGIAWRNSEFPPFDW